MFDAEDEEGVSPEFKREAVTLLESSGRPVMQIASELGISPSMLRNWRAVAHGGTARSRAATPRASPLSSPADQASEISSGTSSARARTRSRTGSGMRFQTRLDLGERSSGLRGQPPGTGRTSDSRS